MNNPTIDLEALFQLNYGMYIVSSSSGGKINGCIINTLFQLTPEPPVIAMSLNKKALTYEYLNRSGLFSVSVLSEDAPMQFIGTFGFRSGRDINKFEGVNIRTGLAEVPIVLDNTTGFVEAEVIQKLDVGSHVLFIAKVLACEQFDNGKIPMTYNYYRDVKGGKTPRTAATYIKTEKPRGKRIGRDSKEDTMKKYKCLMCGYIYDPVKGDPENDIEPGTAFQDLPEDWVCPECGAPKSEFEVAED